MKRAPDTAIFGQGPNKIGWRCALKRWRGNVALASLQAADEACTGEVGERLASLCGEVPPQFYVKHLRFNLNACWNGKSNNHADAYDPTEAIETANRILTEHSQIRKVVCLGRLVGQTIGFSADAPFLSIDRQQVNGAAFARKYLLLPHPSGRNRWWNYDSNRRLASLVLRGFLYG
jgi:hypothetical protein